MRETFEEIGVDVAKWRRLGRLCDDRVVTNLKDPLVVSMFGFASEGKDPTLRLDAKEVAYAWWVDVDEIDPTKVQWRSVESCSLTRRLPSWLLTLVRSLGGHFHVASLQLPSSEHEPAYLWGLTMSCFSDAFRRFHLQPLIGPGTPFPRAVASPIPALDPILHSAWNIALQYLFPPPPPPPREEKHFPTLPSFSRPPPTNGLRP